MTDFALGLDIGATKVLGVAVDPAGSVLESVRIATEPGGDGVLRTAGAAVRNLLTRLDHHSSNPTVGVGVPGLVDADRGVVLHAVNVGIDHEEFPLRDRLEDRLGLRVAVENDVNAAALGASALVTPTHATDPDLAYLSIGTGLAAGLVLGGRLRRGAYGAAGEIGHVPVDSSGPLCPCGQRGCLEVSASGTALASAWPTEDGVGPAQALFAAAAAGDPRAAAVKRSFAAAVADAVRMLALTVDVDAVVLGGGVSEVGKPLHSAVAQALREQAQASSFLRSLNLAGRLHIVPRRCPVAAVGAAMLGRSDHVSESFIPQPAAGRLGCGSVTTRSERS